MFRAILFDLDGVLVESYDAWFHLLNDAAAAWGTPAISAESFDEIWGQGIQADIDRFFHGKTVAEVEEYYREHFRDHLEHMTVVPGGADIFARLRLRGIGIAVITNTSRQQAQQILEIAGLEPDVLVGGTDVPDAKPAPDMIHRACELLDIRTGEALVLGDSRFDRNAARAAGVRFVGMKIAGDETVENLSAFDKRFVSIP